MRFTKDTIPKILAANEGFKKRKYFKSKNSEYENIYEIIGGKLMRRSIGDTSWADSKYDYTEACDYEQTQRFLRENRDELDLDI